MSDLRTQERVAPQPGPGNDVAPALPRWRRVLGETLLGGPASLVIPLLIAVIAILFPYFVNDTYWLRQISMIVILALAVSGVNLSFGYAGEIQFGQAFMYGLGAYVAVILAERVSTEIIFLLVVAGLAAALVGAVIAGPALRFGGWSLALTSFFLVLTIPNLVSIFESYTGGLTGLISLPTPTLFGTPIQPKGLYEVTMVTVIAWFAVYRNLVTSRYGVIFRVLRQSPVLANSLGLSSTRLKLTTYVIGAFPAGVAGCLFAFTNLIVAPTNFTLTLQISMIAVSLLGGIEAIYAVFIAAAVLYLLPENSVQFAKYSTIAYGAFLILAIVLFRGGLSGVGARLTSRLGRSVLRTNMGRPTGSGQPASYGTLPGAVVAAGGHVPADAPDLDRLPGRQLRIEGVSKRFGGVQALNEASLVAEPGSVTALVGANGSGKTTLLNTICGYVRPDSGSITFGERVLTGSKPHSVAGMGVGRTFQTPEIPTGVSVMDVVASGRFHEHRCGLLSSMLRLPRYWECRRTDREQALRMLGVVGLADLAHREASSLSLGTRRLVEVARALCGGVGLILLDEPASGLSEEEVELLARIVIAAANAGATVVVIEHNFGFVTAVSEIAHVLDFGKVLASGPASAIGRDPKVIESFLGQSPEGLDEAAPTAVEGSSALGQATPVDAPDETTDVMGPVHGDGSVLPMPGAQSAGPILEVSSCVGGYGDLQVLYDVSLSISPGEVSVLLGRNGVGKTTLLGTIAGQVPLWSGSIQLAGTEVGRDSAYRRAAAGIALVQEGKRIFRERTILENVTIGTFTQRCSRKERRRQCDEVLEHFPALRERANERAGGLSGGQQQMLAIAQALASRPRILLLDEPSAGLAPAIVAELFGRVRELADGGVAILLVEQLADRALAIADHVSVIDSGRIVASGTPSKFHDRSVLREAYFGAGDER